MLSDALRHKAVFYLAGGERQQMARGKARPWPPATIQRAGLLPGMIERSGDAAAAVKAVSVRRRYRAVSRWPEPCGAKNQLFRSSDFGRGRLGQRNTDASISQSE